MVASELQKSPFTAGRPVTQCLKSIFYHEGVVKSISFDTTQKEIFDTCFQCKLGRFQNFLFRARPSRATGHLAKALFKGEQVEALSMRRQPQNCKRLHFSKFTSFDFTQYVFLMFTEHFEPLLKFSCQCTHSTPRTPKEDLDLENFWSVEPPQFWT